MWIYSEVQKYTQTLLRVLECLATVVVVHFLEELDDQTCGQDFHDVVLVPVVVGGHHETAFLQEDAAEEEDGEHGGEEKGAEFHCDRFWKRKKYLLISIKSWIQQFF